VKIKIKNKKLILFSLNTLTHYKMDYAIPLRNKKKEIIAYTYVDQEDFERVNQFPWCMSKIQSKVYVMSKTDINKTRSLHQFIMGNTPKGMVIDHKDGDGLNNRKVYVGLSNV